MAGLLDIAPLVEEFDIRGTKIDVGGISAAGVANLLSRFPDLGQLVTGRSNNVDPDRLFSLGGDVVQAVIAAGCGSPGDKGAEEAAGKLSVGEQADLLGIILRISLPNGLAPILRLGAILNGDGASQKVPATKSRK